VHLQIPLPHQSQRFARRQRARGLSADGGRRSGGSSRFFQVSFSFFDVTAYTVLEIRSIDDKVEFVDHAIDIDDTELKVFEPHCLPHAGSVL
jgi:hypothetical protein